MASIGIGTVLASSLQAKGWDLIQNITNASTKSGLFTLNGTPFYLGLNENSNTPDTSSGGSTTLGGKLMDAVSGALKNFDDMLSKAPDISVEAGVVDLNYTKTTEITNAPLMRGQFSSYNKVVRPTEASVNYVVTGTEKQRKTFERAVDKARLSFQLFTLHTVELTIPYVNIVGYSVPRDSRSQQMYNIAIRVQEVMQNANATALANATAGSGTAKETGELQTQDATGSQIQSAKKVL